MEIHILFLTDKLRPSINVIALQFAKQLHTLLTHVSMCTLLNENHLRHAINNLITLPCVVHRITTRNKNIVKIQISYMNM
jgi:hypothetical protein